MILDVDAEGAVWLQRVLQREQGHRTPNAMARLINEREPNPDGLQFDAATYKKMVAGEPTRLQDVKLRQAAAALFDDEEYLIVGIVNGGARQAPERVRKELLAELASLHRRMAELEEELAKPWPA